MFRGRDFSGRPLSRKTWKLTLMFLEKKVYKRTCFYQTTTFQCLAYILERGRLCVWGGGGRREEGGSGKDTMQRRGTRGRHPGVILMGAGSLREVGEERVGDGVPKEWELGEITNKFRNMVQFFMIEKAHIGRTTE